jgi:hypothetical protein
MMSPLRSSVLCLTLALLSALLVLPSAQACFSVTCALPGVPPVADGFPSVDCETPILPCHASVGYDKGSIECQLPSAVEAILRSLGNPPTIYINLGGTCAGITYSGGVATYQVYQGKDGAVVRTLNPLNSGQHGAFGSISGDC